MSLDLDNRQRAMLREMGVRVWQPMAASLEPTIPMPTIPVPPLAKSPAPAVGRMSADPHIAINSIAGHDRLSGATGTIEPKPAPVQALQPARYAAPASSGPAVWNLADALVLYADAAAAKGPRWLVLAESAAAALQSEPFNPFEGDAGKLLDNMLRAARLHKVGTAMLAPLARRVASNAGAEADLYTTLAGLLASVQPDVVLVMGRLAAQALLQSSEPFGKLRGQVHQLQGIKTIVTHDAAYLLRSPADKAKAWDDLCLAMSVVA